MLITHTQKEAFLLLKGCTHLQMQRYNMFGQQKTMQTERERDRETDRDRQTRADKGATDWAG